MGPAEAGAVRLLGGLAEGVELRYELVHDDLGLEVPDLDAGRCGGAQPVAVRGEHKGVDDVPSVEGVQALAFVEVPEHGGAVLAAGSAEGAVWRHGHRVKVASVAGKVGAQAAVGERPDFDELVPAARHDDRGIRGWAEAHARDPLSVALLLDGVLALAKGVPQLDGLVVGGGREGDDGGKLVRCCRGGGSGKKKH